MINRTIAALLLLLAAVPLLAQGAGDHGLTIAADVTRVPLHTRVAWRIQFIRPARTSPLTVEVDLPGHDLGYDGTCSGTKPVRCQVPAAYDSLTFASTLDTAGTSTATARILAPADANPQNDHSSWTIEVVDQPSLTVSLSVLTRLDPASAATIYAGVTNHGAPASDVVLTLTPPPGATFTGELQLSDPAVTCALSADTIVCSRSTLGAGAFFSVLPKVLLPDRLDGSDVTFAASVTSSGPEFDPSDDSETFTSALIRHILVVNTNDEGAGSLRQALLDAEQLCAFDLCTIDFRIPDIAAGQRAVIRVRNELPVMQGLVRLDGATQTAFGGDTYAEGPEVVIDGSLTAPHTRGLVLGGPSCEMYVLDLAVANFPGSGIQAHRGYHLRYGNGCLFPLFPDTLIARNHLTGNHRGLMVLGAGYTTIIDNVISGSVRAGIFTYQNNFVEILRNRVTNNGASGILLHLGQPGQFEQNGVVEDNVISGNGEWGIARVPTGDVRIRKNAIFGNRYLAIDSGLDGATPNLPSDEPYVAEIPNKPVLFSAQYDPAANKTRVRGRLDSKRFTYGLFTIDFYASGSLSAAGQPEAEQWLAALQFGPEQGHSDFEMELDGDLTGRYITSTNSRVHIANWDDFVHDTSELSDAVTVH
jgi:hypothetical protein